jgi:hypothetical protein
MNVYKDLLFLHGHFVRAEDLVEAGANLDAKPVAADATTAEKSAGSATDSAPSLVRSCFTWLDNLLFLGGRPMRADHPDDIDPPFQSLIDACTTRAPHAQTKR